jgi:hypothetical protein
MRTDLFLWENPAFITRVDEWILNGRPEQNSIEWDTEPWITEFPEYEGFLNELHVKYLGFLNRDLVKKTVQQESANSRYVEGFLAVMIWGYTGDSRGPKRTQRVLLQQNARFSIEKANKALTQNDVKSAYIALVTDGPKYLGPAFASKYLYFASNKNVSPTPLILDSQVVKGLERWGNKFYKSTTASASDYLDYLEYMKLSADKFEINAEELEFLVFSENAKLKGSQAWSNRASSVELAETEKRAWAFFLASEILLRDSNLVAYYSQPGGGQYDCISIRELNKRIGLKVDLNISGSINFIEPKANRYSWEALISRGVSGACELLAQVYGWDHSVDLEKASPWAKSFRSIAKLAINTATDSGIRYECLVVDNSAYGLSIDTGIFEQFPVAEDARNNYSNLLDLPKEAWFWKVIVKDEIVGLIDTFSAIQFLKNGNIKDLHWPQ